MNSTIGIGGASRFNSTHWSVVLAAGLGGDDSGPALEELCRTYWRPIFGFIRRRGHGADEALDLTQGFFASFLERGSVSSVDPARGLFRAYLLAAVKHFLANERERERALKRGGGLRPTPLFGTDDGLPLIDPADPRSPEREFEREWGHALLRRTLERVRAEQEAKGHGELLERLKPMLAGEQLGGGYAAVAAELGRTEVSVKVAAHRLRRRFREVLIEEVARTVDVPQDIEHELNELFRALAP